MSTSKYTVTKLPNGTILVMGRPHYVGELPPPPDPKVDPEIKELLEVALATMRQET